ncbi:MAG: FAD-dependent oxidoreductase [Candidatus Tectimicrobiota bacterium]
MASTRAHRRHLIGIIGAGPAGLYATKKLAEAGAYVVLFNRDIKPGGLAEYGIFPTKYKMKEGLRKQFRRILAHPQVDYYGNCTIGEKGDLTLAELRAFGFDAVLCAAGAQGTKNLGLPGEDAVGVMHAKDLVYHYNSLPPFSQHEFPLGKRVAIIGMGNVMIDIAHFLLRLHKHVDEVIVVARRGPAERKYDSKEYKFVEPFVDQVALQQEIDRLRPRLEAVGQDPEAILAEMQAAEVLHRPADCPGRMTFRFLASPTRVLTDALGHVRGLEIEENQLVLRHGEVAARGTGTYDEIALDSVVFAIGDRVDDSIGFPSARGEFIATPASEAVDTTSAAYQVYDPAQARALDGMYMIGWSRKASDGLVGKAKQDAETGAEVVLKALEHTPEVDPEVLAARRQAVCRLVAERSDALITKEEVTLLETLEQEIARAEHLEEFKFDSNEAMIKAMNNRRTRPL